MVPEKIIQQETVYQGHIFDIQVRQVELPSGAQVNRDVVMNRGAVVIVALTKDNAVRLLKQYRSGAEKWVIELPAGGLEPNEEPDRAAPRELLEETGDQASQWQKLGGFYSAPGILNEYLHVYLATDLTPGPNQLEFDEQIAEVLTIPWSETLAMMKRGDIDDAKTIAALLLAGLHLGLMA